MSWEGFERRLDRGPGPATFAIWKWILLILALGGITTCGVTMITKPFSVVNDVVDDTLDVDNMKYNYEWFKNTYAAVKALDVEIVQGQAAVDQFKKDAGPRKDWHREDREEYNRLNAVLQGLKQQRATLASEFNARSKQVNRSIFKGKDTPVEIPLQGAAQ